MYEGGSVMRITLKQGRKAAAWAYVRRGLYPSFFIWKKIHYNFNLIGDFVKEIPVLNIPQEVIDFIELMKTAKYSTF